jgi:hypothetical protein
MQPLPPWAPAGIAYAKTGGLSIGGKAEPPICRLHLYLRRIAQNVEFILS